MLVLDVPLGQWSGMMRMNAMIRNACVMNVTWKFQIILEFGVATATYAKGAFVPSVVHVHLHLHKKSVNFFE